MVKIDFFNLSPLCNVFPLGTSQKLKNAPRIADPSSLPLKPWHHLWMAPKCEDKNLFSIVNFEIVVRVLNLKDEFE